MFVYLLLPFASRFVPSTAYDLPLRRVEREIANRQPFGTLPNEKYPGLPYGGPPYNWNTLAAHPTPGDSLGGSDFESRRNPSTSLEISKSIELKFDPNNRMLTPVNEEAGKNETAYKSSLSLLTPFTQKRLGKIFEKYDKEAKRADIVDVKNYQTGRFKLYYLKRSRFRV